MKDARPDKRIRRFVGDEARVGQQGTLTRVCARTGSRPTSVRRTEYQWVYLRAAAGPATGASVAMITPTVNAALTNTFLNGLAGTLGADEHAVLVLDNAGRHTAKAVVVPPNVSLLFLPPYTPESNPAERLWLWLREHRCPTACTPTTTNRCGRTTGPGSRSTRTPSKASVPAHGSSAPINHNPYKWLRTAALPELARHGYTDDLGLTAIRVGGDRSGRGGAVALADRVSRCRQAARDPATRGAERGRLVRGRLIGYWLCTAAVLLALHIAFGRRLLALDAADRAAVDARRAEDAGDWAAAERAYAAAVETMPTGAKDHAARIRLRLAVERARVRNGQVISAIGQMTSLLNEAVASREPGLADAVRGELGTARFYAAWLMRRQAGSVIDWTALADAARQDFRYLAETSPRTAAAAGENLRRVVAFQRATDEHVQAEPYPEPPLASNGDVANRYDQEQAVKEQSGGNTRDGRDTMNLDRPTDSLGPPPRRRRTGS